MIVIKPEGGFCNRLRVIFTWLYIARDENKHLTVYWIKDSTCPGTFLDYFQEIDNITFVNVLNRNIKIDYSGCGMHPKYRVKRNYTQEHDKIIYKDLKLLPHIENKVKNNMDLLENKYISVCIRRTDFARAYTLTQDKEFMDFIDKYKYHNIYIATDNRETQNIFYNLYKNRIKVIKFIDNNNNNNLRKTTIEDAIIELYTCINSEYFLGSGFSSFTFFINHMKKDELYYNKSLNTNIILPSLGTTI